MKKLGLMIAVLVLSSMAAIASHQTGLYLSLASGPWDYQVEINGQDYGVYNSSVTINSFYSGNHRVKIVKRRFDRQGYIKWEKVVLLDYIYFDPFCRVQATIDAFGFVSIYKSANYYPRPRVHHRPHYRHHHGHYGHHGHGHGYKTHHQHGKAHHGYGHNNGHGKGHGYGHGKGHGNSHGKGHGYGHGKGKKGHGQASGHGGKGNHGGKGGRYGSGNDNRPRGGRGSNTGGSQGRGGRGG